MQLHILNNPKDAALAADAEFLKQCLFNLLHQEASLLVFMAALIGIIGALVSRVGKGQQFAFGPSLAVAGWIIFIANEPINQLIQWWLTKSGF